jgi:LPS export ABC transporter protein LptC
MLRKGLIVVGIGLSLAACGGEGVSPTSGGDLAELPADQVLYSLRHSMTSEGVRRATLVSDTGFVRQLDREVDLVGVHLTLFDLQGEEQAVLTAETGKMNHQTGEMVARGSVVLLAQGPEGTRRLETEELHFDLHGDRMWSDVNVVMRERGRTMHGTSFRSDGRFENVRVTEARTVGGLPGDPIRF